MEGDPATLVLYLQSTPAEARARLRWIIKGPLGQRLIAYPEKLEIMGSWGRRTMIGW